MIGLRSGMDGQGNKGGGMHGAEKSAESGYREGGTLEGGLQGSGDLVTGMGWGEEEGRAE